jgi:hypothetical protein
MITVTGRDAKKSAEESTPKAITGNETRICP